MRLCHLLCGMALPFRLFVLFVPNNYREAEPRAKGKRL
jgi:hypothetical protein